MSDFNFKLAEFDKLNSRLRDAKMERLRLLGGSPGRRSSSLSPQKASRRTSVGLASPPPGLPFARGGADPGRGGGGGDGDGAENPLQLPMAHATHATDASTEAQLEAALSALAAKDELISSLQRELRQQTTKALANDARFSEALAKRIGAADVAQRVARELKAQLASHESELGNREDTIDALRARIETEQQRAQQLADQNATMKEVLERHAESIRRSRDASQTRTGTLKRSSSLSTARGRTLTRSTDEHESDGGNDGREREREREYERRRLREREKERQRERDAESARQQWERERTQVRLRNVFYIKMISKT